MSEDILIQEKALALKSILKDVKKDLKKHEKVDKVPEGKTDSMEEFLKWADGKDKKKVTKKAISNLSSILSEVKKSVETQKNIDNPSDANTDRLDAEADKQEEIDEVMQSKEYNEEPEED